MTVEDKNAGNFPSKEEQSPLVPTQTPVQIIAKKDEGKQNY